MTIPVIDLGRMGYQAAYEKQTAWVERVVAAREGPAPERGVILLVEHDPVITVSARPTAAGHVIASPAQLAAAGVEVARTDRGGDVTYHGPGQLVAYPIIDLNATCPPLRLHEYMRVLEEAVIRTCADLGVPTQRDPGATGVWTKGEVTGGVSLSPRKIAAMGVRVRRWVSMHGLALNVTTNLRHFDLIVPCGLIGRGVTSLFEELGAERCPTMNAVKVALIGHLGVLLGTRVATERA